MNAEVSNSNRILKANNCLYLNVGKCIRFSFLIFISN